MWRGGFSGVGFTRPEFRKWLSTQKKPPYHRIVNHMTDAPYTKASVPCSTRAKNLGNYYKNDLGWSGGPDFFSLGDGKIYLGSPLGYSIGCKDWNGNSFHIETEGRYDGKKHDYKTGPGLENWKVSAWAQAELIEWMGWELNGDRIKLHKEGNTTHKACPGVVPKDWIIARIAEAMGVNSKGDVQPPSVNTKPSNQLFDVKEIQEHLIVHGFDLGKWGADGILGKMTDSAIRAFQSSLQVEPTGVIGPWAMSLLRKAPKPPAANVEAPEPVLVIPLSEMHISKVGLDHIKHFEGLRLTPYDDVGALAIGYGHSNRSKKPPIVTLDLRITESEAEAILASDLLDYENRVKQSITVPLNQHQFDALVSLAYNWGPGNLDRSELKNMVNAGSHVQAAAEIRTLLPPKTVKHYAGILRRRNKEADLYGGK